MKFINVAMWMLMMTSGVWAQGIAPPLAEYRGSKVDGMFEVQNSTNYTMVTLLEVKSFRVDGKGQVHYGALDRNVQVSLGASSFIVRPHDRRMVFYKALVANPPSSFAIIATMTKAGSVPGMRLNFVLPHIVYVYQKEKLRRGDVRVEDSGGVVRIENTSKKMGRVMSVQGRGKKTGGFPLYPDQTREVAMAGDRITVRFEDGFKIDVR